MSERVIAGDEKSHSKRKNPVSQTQNPDFPDSVKSSLDRILFFQRTIGNQAVQDLFKSGVIRTKLRISRNQIARSLLRSGVRISRSPDRTQRLRLRRRYRYIDRSGAFAEHNFEPDLRTSIRDWLSQNMTVFPSQRPIDDVSTRLIVVFRQAHRDLGTRVALRRNRYFTYTARIELTTSSISITGVSINGHTWTPQSRSVHPGPPRPVTLSPDLEEWWRMLMTSFYTFYQDGSEEFRVTFSRVPRQPLTLVSWYRHMITQGRRRLSSAARPRGDFGRTLRLQLSMAFQSQPQGREMRLIVVRREGASWSVPSSRIVTSAPTPQAGDQVILDRRGVYAQIFRRWHRELREASIAVASIAARELIWWVIGGTILRGLGAVLGRLPILRRLLEGRHILQLNRGLSGLTQREAREFARIARRLHAGQRVSVRQMRRFRELGGRIEAELARLVPATMSRPQMTAFLQETWRQNSVLRRVAGAQRLSGQAQQRELISILTQFERQTGIGVQFVRPGAVQAVRGAGDYASLRSRPGVLQIERQVLRSPSTLMREVRHALSHYYVGRLGRVLSFGSFNALDLLEMMVRSGGRLPPPLRP